MSEIYIVVADVEIIKAFRNRNNAYLFIMKHRNDGLKYHVEIIEYE